MADRKISELTQITGANVDDANDEIAIVDTSASETKAITRAELFSGIDGNITLSGTVDGRDVAADGSKLDGIETNADVTDTANVTAAGALMDSELTSEASVKALDQGVATTDSPDFAGLTVDEATLSAIAETKADTAVDVFVYDTSKDSDGGAWRHRTQHTSWYNETLNTATRGSRREFPAVAVIVAEADDVTIYDGDDPALPMWMVFNKVGSGKGTSYMGGAVTSTASSISMQNAELCIGSTGSWADLRVIYFLSDGAAVYRTDSYTGASNIANRNTALGVGDDSLQNLVNDTVNDVAMTVLPDAPTDPATGIQRVTIACATDGGVSVIKDDGTVVDIASTRSTFVDFAFDHTFIAEFDTGTPEAVYRFDIPAADQASFSPNLMIYNNFRWSGAAQRRFVDSVDPIGVGNFVNFGSDVGLTRTINTADATAPSTNFQNYTTSTYNTGWMNGDIKGAFLSDTDDTDLVGSGELVTNGTFDTDTDWTKGTGWTISGGVASVDTSVSGAGVITRLQQDITTVVGKTYVISADFSNLTNVEANEVVFQAPTGDNIIVDSDGSYSVTFVATSTTSTITIRTSGAVEGDETADVDNVSVKLADEDRSVNNNGLIVNGTVTREPVATGADLVAYSGFSPSNYLEQPYNSDLDFGTGDFCVMGWVKPASSARQYIVSRYSASNFFLVRMNSGGAVQVYAGSGASAVSTSELDTNTWRFVTAVRSSGVLQMYVDGMADGSSMANTTDTTDTDATLTVGMTENGSAYQWEGSLALLRISATAPTAEQIAKIYEDEKFLFQENAQATLFGASDAVTALAHDPVTDLLHVGTSDGRSVFQGLRRVENTTDAVSTAISAHNGMVVDQ